MPATCTCYQRINDTSDVLGLGDQPHDVIVLPKNGEVVVVLTWDDPAGRSANNYDLYLVRESSGQVVARSTDAQRGAQDPIEFVDFVNREDEGRFRILIQNVNDARRAAAVERLLVPAAMRRLADRDCSPTAGTSATTTTRRRAVSRRRATPAAVRSA